MKTRLINICNWNYQIQFCGGRSMRKHLKRQDKGLHYKGDLSTRPRSRVAIRSRTAKINFGFVYNRLRAKPHGRN